MTDLQVAITIFRLQQSGKKMNLFISCDWGTSSFRLRLINAETKAVLAEIKSLQGIAATYSLWRNQAAAANRVQFYTEVIMQQIRELEKQSGYLLSPLSVVVSGMASSSIGMIELPYKPVPFCVYKVELETHCIPATAGRNQMIIVSGVRSANDIMRGEETILAGCNIEDSNDEQLFIFPGTHSKHVTVQNSMLIDITSYMTGELFDLLSTKSLLAASVEANEIEAKGNTSFNKGIREAMNNNFLNNIFHTRTNQLFGLLNKYENYHYLSGLLLGEELRHVLDRNYSSVTLVSEGFLLDLYTEALSALGLKNKLRQQSADEALIAGQLFIFSHYQ
jgi:2-dehydro-3-deoxygalactonokinase